MRVAELSARTGVSVATLKYYLREGLLPPGRPTARNQAAYDDAHVQRVRVVRVLIEVGGMPIASVRDVVAALDSRRSTASVVGVVHHALTPGADGPPDDDVSAALGEVDAWLRDIGWEVSRAAPGRRTLAEALVALRRLRRDVRPQDLTVYAEAADRVAGWELAQTAGAAGGSRSELVESVVVGTVVYESVLLALRRLAQERHFAAGQPTAGGSAATSAADRRKAHGRR